MTTFQDCCIKDNLAVLLYSSFIQKCALRTNDDLFFRRQLIMLWFRSTISLKNVVVQVNYFTKIMLWCRSTISLK